MCPEGHEHLVDTCIKESNRALSEKAAGRSEVGKTIVQAKRLLLDQAGKLYAIRFTDFTTTWSVYVSQRQTCKLHCSRD